MAMINLQVEKYPIYGADINDGRIEVFQTTEEAIAFLAKTESLVSERDKICLDSKAKLDKPMPYYLLAGTSDECKSELIMNCEI